MVVAVTATNDAGTDTAASAPSALLPAPPVNAVAPSISGDEEVGETLTADPGELDGTDPMTIDYQWQRCDAAGDDCEDIAGATDETYTLTDEDPATRSRSSSPPATPRVPTARARRSPGRRARRRPTPTPTPRPARPRAHARRGGGTRSRRPLAAAGPRARSPAARRSSAAWVAATSATSRAAWSGTSSASSSRATPSTAASSQGHRHGARARVRHGPGDADSRRSGSRPRSAAARPRGCATSSTGAS